MQLSTHTKNYTISDKFRAVLTKKIGYIERYFDENAACAVLCTRIGKTEKLEITLTQKGRIFRAEAVSGNMFVNIDLALSKLERQIIKNKEKLRTVLRKEGIDEKKYSFYTKSPRFDPVEVMKQKAFSVEALTEQEAELALDTTDHNFYVYANKKNARINIMYKRADGHIGIIEITNSKVS